MHNAQSGPRYVMSASIQEWSTDQIQSEWVGTAYTSNLVKGSSQIWQPRLVNEAVRRAAEVEETPCYLTRVVLSRSQNPLSQIRLELGSLVGQPGIHLPNHSDEDKSM
jgi:hypothetical protein